MTETSTTSQQVERIAETSFDSDTIVLDVEVLDRRIAPAQFGFSLQNQPFTPHLEDCCN